MEPSPREAGCTRRKSSSRTPQLACGMFCRAHIPRQYGAVEKESIALFVGLLSKRHRRGAVRHFHTVAPLSEMGNGPMHEPADSQIQVFAFIPLKGAARVVECSFVVGFIDIIEKLSLSDEHFFVHSFLTQWSGVPSRCSARSFRLVRERAFVRWRLNYMPSCMGYTFRTSEAPFLAVKLVNRFILQYVASQRGQAKKMKKETRRS